MKSHKIFYPLFVAAFTLGGCENATSLPRQPISTPFSLAEKGNVKIVDFEAIENDFIYTFSLDLLVDAKHPADLEKLAALWGGNGGYFKGTNKPIPVGIPIPVRLTISRIENTKQISIYEKEFYQEPNWSGSDVQLSKLIDYIRLSPAHYRVRLETLEEVPELANVAVNFRILIQKK